MMIDDETRRGESGEARRDEFDSLARESEPSLRRMALRLTGDSDAAEDLLQDSLIRGFLHFHQFEPGTNFPAWMSRVIRTTFLNQEHLRARAARTTSVEDMPEWHELADPHTDTVSQIFDDLLAEHWEKALAELPAEFRNAVWMADVEDQSYDEVARQENIPIGTVRSRISRGRARLQDLVLRYVNLN